MEEYIQSLMKSNRNQQFQIITLLEKYTDIGVLSFERKELLPIVVHIIRDIVINRTA